MARCSVCKKPITKEQQRKAKEDRNEEGKLIGQRHGKCERKAIRKAAGPKGGKAISAYDQVRNNSDDEAEKERLAKEANEALARQREETDTDERVFHDHHEPATLDLNDLME